MRQVALVTGGAVRVGRALSIGLAEAGYDMVVHHHSSGAAALEVGRRVEELGRRAVTVQGDLSDPAAADELATVSRERYGRLDLLVNNASVFRPRPLPQVDAGEWDLVMDVNLRAPFLVTRATADLLRDSGGCVVNIADLSAFRPFPSYPAHSVAKAGLVQLTRALAQQLAPRVRVNAVAPGTVLPPEDAEEDEIERERSRTALGTLGSPEDVVRTVLFLAGSPFVTGEVVVVDGGRDLAR
ncbi:MAG: SDR family oxidoreductase [Gemmatimonadota bacterium]